MCLIFYFTLFIYLFYSIFYFYLFIYFCDMPSGRNGVVHTCLALYMINLLLIITVPINYIMHNIICSVCAMSDLLFIVMM